jgi:hypothetical protein
VEPTEVPVGVIVGEDLRPVAGMRSGVWPFSALPAAVVPIAAIEDPASATQALIEAGFEVEVVLVRGEVAPDGPRIRAYRLDHRPSAPASPSRMRLATAPFELSSASTSRQ